MKKALAERILGAEPHASSRVRPRGGEAGGAGESSQRQYAQDRPHRRRRVDARHPRDRAGTFAPQLVPKHARRLPGFDQQVLSLYARGLTVREIQGHLEELYQIEIAPSVISTVTDAVLEEVTQWQQRPLERVYPVVLFDCLRVKIRDEGVVRNKAVYVALGVERAGHKDVLGLWVEQTEGAGFWLRVMPELKSRGVEDILTRWSTGLELKAIYRAPTEAAAEAALRAFETSPLGTRFPTIAPIWRRHWEYLRPVFVYPPLIRRLLYTTNAIESLHMQLRKVTKTRAPSRTTRRQSSCSTWRSGTSAPSGSMLAPTGPSP
jgi:putative transposase